MLQSHIKQRSEVCSPGSWATTLSLHYTASLPLLRPESVNSKRDPFLTLACPHLDHSGHDIQPAAHRGKCTFFIPSPSSY